MRNGSIALGLGLFVIAVLAAEGKLQELWRAVMDAGGPLTSAGTATVDTGNLPGAKASGSSGAWQPVGTATVNTGALGGKLDPTRYGPQNTTLYPTPLPGQSGLFDQLWASIPAGDPGGTWQSFLACYHQTGDIAGCQYIVAKG